MSTSTTFNQAVNPPKGKTWSQGPYLTERVSIKIFTSAFLSHSLNRGNRTRINTSFFFVRKSNFLSFLLAGVLGTEIGDESSLWVPCFPYKTSDVADFENQRRNDDSKTTKSWCSWHNVLTHTFLVSKFPHREEEKFAHEFWSLVLCKKGIFLLNLLDNAAVEVVTAWSGYEGPCGYLEEDLKPVISTYWDP